MEQIIKVKKIIVICECRNRDGRVKKEEIAFESIDDCVVESVGGTKNKLTCYFKSFIPTFFQKPDKT